jgi:hypothetical protein
MSRIRHNFRALDLAKELVCPLPLLCKIGVTCGLKFGIQVKGNPDVLLYD